jgi:transcription factor E
MKNLLVEIAGEKALQVAGELSQPLTDEALAEAAKIKISEVRAVMNKLHSARIAAYARTRNEDGWYTYTWSLALGNAQKILEERGLVRKAPKAGAGDSAEYYACPNCFSQGGKKFCFDKAAEAEFKCPECSEMLKFVEKKG